MSLKLGSTGIGSLYLGSTKIGTGYLGGSLVYLSPVPPNPNPLNLPANTVRMKFRAGHTPTTSLNNCHVSKVSSVPNVWDFTDNYFNIYYSLDDLLSSTSKPELIEVLGANMTGVKVTSFMFSKCSNLTTVAYFDTSSVTRMSAMFQECFSLSAVPRFDTSNVTTTVFMFGYCTSLNYVPLFNTSRVTDFGSMFYHSSVRGISKFDTSSGTIFSSMFSGCSNLTSVPQLDTSSATRMTDMFRDCVNVQSGALALYTQASTQATPPTDHSGCFMNCGSNTVTGAQELESIPTDWK